jgi:uncharacterized protein (DUF305 family)
VTGSGRGRRLALVVLGAVVLLAVGIGIGLLAGDRSDVAGPGPVDVGFAQDMTVHHQQAVDMATTELTGGADVDVKNLAYDILTSQQSQIGRMQGWLTSWGEPLLPTGGYMGWMSHGEDMHQGHDMHDGPGSSDMRHGAVSAMPGMASSEDLARLRRAAPAERDVLFLQLMLRHHQGGADMLAAAADGADVGYVRDLARQMLATQISESNLMTEMLRKRNAPVLPLR